jgi:hypothetical protein
MGRIASIAVALVLLTAAPAAQAGLLQAIEEAGKVAAEDGAKEGVRAAEHTATGVKIENKVGSPEAKGASLEATGVKFEGGGGSGGGSGDDPPPWFYVLCVVGVGVWLLSKFRGKRA